MNYVTLVCEFGILHFIHNCTEYLNLTFSSLSTHFLDPRQIYVPTEATTAMLIGSSRFRSKARLPVLTYLHSNHASICRCSQPLSGFSARCLEDEQMLEAIRNTNPNSKFMYVVDTRPRINAMANRAAGKGYENEAFYENIKFQFLGIENIHVMRTSLQKLVESECPISENNIFAVFSLFFRFILLNV